MSVSHHILGLSKRNFVLNPVHKSYYTLIMIMRPYRYIHDNSTNEMLRKTKQHNTTERQSNNNTTQLAPEAVIFQRKNELPQVGLEPTTFCVLDRCSYPLSYRGSSAGWAESHIQIKAKQSKASQPDKQVNSNLA